MLSAALRRQSGIFRLLVARQIREKYVNSGAGLLWAFLVPLAQLAIYAFVFIEIFRVRFPGMDGGGYIAFVAVVMWPWNAFAESLQRAATAVNDHQDLIGKIAVPFELLPLTTVTASFLVNLLGFTAILVLLIVLGHPISLAGLPAMLLVLLALYFFTVGLAFVVSALNVFIRDVAHLLPPLLMLWYFATPILYPLSFVPERYRDTVALNPMTDYAQSLRSLLLGERWLPGVKEIVLFVVAGLVLAVGLAFFRRVSSHFEDYL